MFTETDTFAGVLPDAGATESQAAELVAVQGIDEASEAVTCKACTAGLAPPRCAVKLSVAGETLSVAAAACVTVNVCPAIVSVPARLLVLVFAATE
jgi:hypothetical protein